MIKRFFLILVFILLAMNIAYGQVSKTWNLDSVYPLEKDWLNAVNEIKTGIAAIDAAPKKVKDGQQLATLLSQVSELRGKAGKLAKVGLLKHFTDTQNEDYQRKMEQSEFLETQVEASVAFISNLVKSIPPSQLESWRQHTPALIQHQRRLNRILLLSSHQLNESSEAILADLTRLPRAANDVYRAVMNSDLTWPLLDGEPLTPTKYRKIARNGTLAQREAAAKLFFNRLSAFQDVFALALTRRIEGESLIAKHRNLASSVDTLLVLQDGFPSLSYRKLFNVIKKQQGNIGFIVNTLATTKSQASLSPSDFRALLNTEQRHYDLPFARQLTLKAAEKIGMNYQQLMKKRLDLPWMHLADDEQKSNTVGVFWQVGGGAPHTIFKYRQDYLSLRLYSSAAFLMMGLANIPQDQVPDRREEDLPVFSNALWYLGHFMQTDALIEQSTSEPEKREVLANLLTRTFNTLVNYAVMVALEDFISRTILSGESITANDINHFYYSTLNAFISDRTMVIDEHWKYGWMMESFAFYGPHYASFYQAIAAALALKARVDKDDTAALHTVQFGIADSQTHFSADVLMKSNINMNDESTYEEAIETLYQMAKKLSKITGS